MQNSNLPTKWIDEETYRTTVLALYPHMTENDADEKIQHDAKALGILLPVQVPIEIDGINSSLSATTISSEANHGSILSQSTDPTSCGSSERRPSTSLSTRSSRIGMPYDPPAAITDVNGRRHSGLRSGLRKMTGFKRKKGNGSNTPSMTSIRSQLTGSMIYASTTSPPKATTSIKSGDSHSSQSPPPTKESFDQVALVDEQALRRTMECDTLLEIRTQQLEEKRRFLEYQTRLVAQLLAERESIKDKKKELYAKIVAEREEKNERAVEELEARQLEEELKQQKEHEAEKRGIQTRLRHMEAYCQTPSPPQSPTVNEFNRPSLDSVATMPERHVTQQHYESLAQAYHVRDNMDGLHASKINVLRGKQKRALQNFMLKKEREVEQMEKDHAKELGSIDLEYAKKESEIRQEFELKRTKIEARWRLQVLIEKTRMERETGLKYELLPDVLAIEA